jgi:GxxExxY protein
MGTDAAPEPKDGLHNRRITQAIIGQFFAVYNELGSGFVESVYRNALSVALDQCGVRNVREAPLDVFFRGARVGQFRTDVLVDDCVVVETKVAPTIERAHEGQLLNYLRASRIETGLILNFGPKATFRRLIYTNDRKTSAR